MTTDPAPAPVPLGVLAADLNESVDSLANRLGSAAVFRNAAGLRCCTVFRSHELIAQVAAEREAAEAEKRRREEASRARFREVAAKHRPRGGVALSVPNGMSPAAAMMAVDGRPQYDDATYRPVPTSADWLFEGAGDTGGTIGPSVDEIRRGRRKNRGAR